MENSLIEIVPVHIHHYESDQPTQLRLINNQEILSLEEQIKSLKKKKTKLKLERITQLNNQEKDFLEKITEIQKTRRTQNNPAGTRKKKAKRA